ncbi:hypothetical protein [Pontiella sulfatireligans]|uniref:Uncharacterized protein n=1 Tax=Pontiella sulfatireligans TaxID=2750658 RepID=A0A6C2UR49_9BACT|nr:hypothetical protein [Pontiella sulfatireligans]VGO22775.1 hypothetical protein SCARR_04872 [Pontiella sulfatireligans]
MRRACFPSSSASSASARFWLQPTPSSRCLIHGRWLKSHPETRRSGSKTTTSVIKTPVYEEELRQTENNQGEIAPGTLQFQIPDDQPASRLGRTNGICWQTVFHGDIARWPDMKQELAFTVYPDS